MRKAPHTFDFHGISEKNPLRSKENKGASKTHEHTKTFQNNVLWTEESQSFLTSQQACLMKAEAKFDRLQGFSL